MSKWKKVKLSTLCSRIGDGLHGTPNYIECGDIFFINGNNIKGGKIIVDDETKRVTQEELDKNFVELNSNSLLLSINGTLGNMAFFNGENVMLGKSAAYLNFKTNINRFYFYYFQLPNIQKYFYDVATGSTIKNLSLKSLQEFEVPLPDNNEYQKIAAVLSALDDKIELNNRINAELEEMAKTLYDYWFVQFDFPYSPLSEGCQNSENFDGVFKPYKSSGGKMVYNSTLKREIPEGWEVKNLGELGNFKNGVNYNPSNPGKIPCPIINVRNISNSSYFIKNEDLDIIYLNDNDVRKYSVNENSIIIARSGIPGATRLISDFSANTLYCGFAIHYEIYNPLLKNQVFFYLKSLEELIKSGSGGTIMKNVNQELLNNLIIQVPEKSISTAFNKKIDIIFKKINNLEKQNQELSALRDWLLPMLMNGQVKVG